MAPEKLTILFHAANPDDTGTLLLDEEVRAIDAAVEAVEQRDRFDLRSRPQILQILRIKVQTFAVTAIRHHNRVTYSPSRLEPLLYA